MTTNDTDNTFNYGDSATIKIAQTNSDDTQNLTEQWKAGELPSRDDEHIWLSYYIKHNDGYIHADSYWRGKWGTADRFASFMVAEVAIEVILFIIWWELIYD